MMTKLELEPPERKAKKPKIGGIYGIKICAIWYRVKLIDIVNDDQALVFYIDVGDKETVSFSELYEPEDIYFSVAPQVKKVIIHFNMIFRVHFRIMIFYAGYSIVASRIGILFRR